MSSSTIEPATSETHEPLIRPARRPEAWVAPGPRPLGDQGRPELVPGLHEDLCYLTGEWRIFQRTDGNRWTLDDLVCAWYARQHAPRSGVHRALDLGCGIGSVLMMVAWLWPEVRSIGLEAQDVSVDLARRSLAYNGADDRVEVRHGDLRELSLLPEAGTFDLVTGTPPYLPHGKGTESDKIQCRPCRFETRGGIEAYCEAAARALAPHGRFVVAIGMNPPERTFAAAAAAGLRIVAWREIVPREGKATLLCTFAMERLPAGAEPQDPPAPEPPLVVRDRQSRFTWAFAQLRREMGLPVHDSAESA